MRISEIINAMGTGEKPVISFVGAGGKTSSILEMAKDCVLEGEKIFVTTTVHMEAPRVLKEAGVIDGTAELVEEEIRKRGWIIAGASSENPDKIQRPSGEVWQAGRKIADKVLVEADGSRKYPIKVPKDGEPVIPEESTHILVLTGASALGKSLSEVCHRSEYAAQIVENTEEKVTSRILGVLLEEGYIKKLKEHYPEKKMAVVLNQSDILENPEEVRQSLQHYISVPVFLHKREPEVHFIFLAAGFSRRFGGNKLLYNMKGKPMYAHLLERLIWLKKRGIAESVTVVTQYEEIRKQAKLLGAKVVMNEQSALGISSSLKLGLAKAMEEAGREKSHYYVFFTADQPFLQEKTIEGFLEGFLKSHKSIGCICDDKIPKNPVAFSGEYVKELMSLEGDTGGKRVLKSHLEEVFFYESEDKKELKDFDFLEEIF